MQPLGDLFEEEEARLLAQAKADIAAEIQRYISDPVYRAQRDADHKAKLDAYPDVFVEDEDEEE